MKIEHAGGRKPTTPLRKMAPVLIISAMTIMAAAVAAGSVIIPPRSGFTLTGIVSDSVCGSDHGTRAPGDAECTRSCVELGAQYALMVGRLKVGKKMYLLHGHQGDLERFAGKEVRVKGRALGRDTIIVDRVDGWYSETAAGMK